MYPGSFSPFFLTVKNKNTFPMTFPMTSLVIEDEPKA